jgi:Protein of unknown function (DUF2490)
MRTRLPTACLLLFASTASGQDADTTNEFWPEVNVFINLGERSRLFAMYTATRQESLGTYADGQTGIYFDFWTLPPFRRRLNSHADLSRSKMLLLRTGYLFSRPKNNSGAATEHMLTFEATGRMHLPTSLLLSDRSRIDLRWPNGAFRWRYRNRLKLERTFRAGRFELTPYGHVEGFYSVDTKEWTRLRYAAGAEWALTRNIVLEGYYLRQNEWASTPRFVNAAGVVVQFYFR